MSTVAIVSKYVAESRKIAEQVAFGLGYPLVTVDDLVKAAAGDNGYSEKELFGAVRDTSLFHQYFRKRKMKLVSLLELKLCEFMSEKPMVFCGYLGYPVFQEISHVLHVLVLAHPEPGKKEAGYGAMAGTSLQSDEKILKWFQTMYGVNMEDPNLYDLCVNLWHMNESESADIIMNTLNQKRFTPMTYSIKLMKDLQLAFRVKTKLIQEMPDIQVKSHDSNVYLYSRAFKRGRKKAVDTKHKVMWMDGVDYVEIYTDPKSFQKV